MFRATRFGAIGSERKMSQWKKPSKVVNSLLEVLIDNILVIRLFVK